MSIFENRLAMSCKQVGEASSEFLEWIDSNETLVGEERIALLREFYRAGISAQRLASAVNMMPCVAVAGPRRSGKTQLMCALVERGKEALSLRFDGIQEPIGFARQIVPEGGRFGTACVIRLSAKARPTPQNFPIAVRLMSIADLIKLIGSIYLTAAPDRREHLPGVIRVRAMLQETKPASSGSVPLPGLPPPLPMPGLREDDIWEIRDHFATTFADEPILRVLSAAGYWEFLAEHASRIDTADRARLLGLLWGELPELSAIFLQLNDALGRLGYGREASCALDAILGLDQRTGRFVRRPDSILAAQTLGALGEIEEQTVVIRTELGQWVSLSRAVLAALVTEVRLPVKGYQSDLLEKADLVELPSIEPREAVPALAQALGEDRTLAIHLFMKAKAVRLVERYSADKEITAMVVCIDPATKKLGELPRLVADWIEHTHGTEPAERDQNDCGLFLAFTKIDREWSEPVRRGRDRRIDMPARLSSILTAEFGRAHDWPLEWTTGRAFDNVHLVRNPSARVKQLFDYDNLGRETGCKPAMLERIEEARREFVKSDVARAHVADPAAMWNEALELNDGGITYLAQSIDDVCDMRVKQRQILSSLNGLKHAMKDRLRRYYVSDNYGLQQTQRHGAALQVVRRIRVCAEARKLGHLIRALQIPDAELHDVLGRLAEVRRHQDVDGDDAPSEADAFAAATVGHWIETIRTAAGAADASRRFQLPPHVLLNLVDEMIVGASRLDLAPMIARRIETETGAETDAERRVMVAAMCAANTIGEFVMWLGFNDARSNSRPRRKGRTETPIFPPRKAVDLSRLEADDETDERFHADWAQAFMTLVGENAANLRERDLNTEQNRRLGQLLMLLDATI